MIHVQLLKVSIIVLLSRLDVFQVEVALDADLKLFPVDAAIVLSIAAVKNFLQLGNVRLTQGRRCPRRLLSSDHGLADALEVFVLLDKGGIVYLNQVALCHLFFRFNYSRRRVFLLSLD